LLQGLTGGEDFAAQIAQAVFLSFTFRLLDAAHHELKESIIQVLSRHCHQDFYQVFIIIGHLQKRFQQRLPGGIFGKVHHGLATLVGDPPHLRLFKQQLQNILELRHRLDQFRIIADINALLRHIQHLLDQGKELIIQQLLMLLDNCQLRRAVLRLQNFRQQLMTRLTAGQHILRNPLQFINPLEQCL